MGGNNDVDAYDPVEDQIRDMQEMAVEQWKCDECGECYAVHSEHGEMLNCLEVAEREKK